MCTVVSSPHLRFGAYPWGDLKTSPESYTLSCRLGKFPFLHCTQINNYSPQLSLHSLYINNYFFSSPTIITLTIPHLLNNNSIDPYSGFLYYLDLTHLGTTKVYILRVYTLLSDHRRDNTPSITVDNDWWHWKRSYLLLSYFNFYLLTSCHLLPINDFYWSELWPNIAYVKK